MDEEHETAGDDGDAPSYEPPRITYEETLEFLAVSCTGATGKGSVGICPIGPIRS